MKMGMHLKTFNAGVLQSPSVNPKTGMEEVSTRRERQSIRISTHMAVRSPALTYAEVTRSITPTTKFPPPLHTLNYQDAVCPY